MTDLEALVIEWRNAREAIFLVNWGDPVVAKANTSLWTRLGHAESALMQHARTIEPEPLPPSKPCQDCGGDPRTCDCLPW